MSWVIISGEMAVCAALRGNSMKKMHYMGSVPPGDPPPVTALPLNRRGELGSPENYYVYSCFWGLTK